jgi:hypothetical protein
LRRIVAGRYFGAGAQFVVAPRSGRRRADPLRSSSHPPEQGSSTRVVPCSLWISAKVVACNCSMCGCSYIGVIRSTGHNFGSYETWATFTFNGTRGNFLMDVDGDGRADLVGVGDGYVGVLRSTGSGWKPYETWYANNF